MMNRFGWSLLLLILAPCPVLKAQVTLPLKPAREINFDVSEGTQMSVDVSPDGKAVAFDLLGDIYTVPITGGVAKRLTRPSLAVARQPRYSPDGKHISFVSDGRGNDDAWVMDAQGRRARPLTSSDPTQVVKASFLEVGPAGDWLSSKSIVVPELIEGTFGLSSVGLDDNRRRALFKDRSCNATGVRAIAGERGSDLLVICWRANGPGSEIRRVNPAENTSKTIVARPDFSIVGMAVNGRRLLYATSSYTDVRTLTLWSHDLSATDQAADVRIAQVGLSTLAPWSAPGFGVTPDGQEVVIASEGKLVRINLADGSVRPVPFTVHVHKLLGPSTARKTKLDDGPLRVEHILEPRFSPDATQLVYGAAGKVWLRQADGSSRRLTHRPLTDPVREFDPAFSPDGRWVAFATWSEEDGGQLWKVLASGGEPQALLTGSSDQTRAVGTPRWSPDGRRLAFFKAAVEFNANAPRTGQRAGSYSFDGSRHFAAKVQLAWVNASGGQAYLIPGAEVTAVSARHPHDLAFSGDGTHLYFWLASDGNAPKEIGGSISTLSVSLYAVDLGSASTAPTRLIKLTSSGAANIDLRGSPSPRGDWVAVEYAGEVMLIRMPGNTSVPEIALSHPCIVSACLANGSGSTVIQVTDGGGSAPSWSDDGKWLSWHYGSTVHRARLADLIDPRTRTRSRTIGVQLTLPRHLPTRSLLLKGARIVTTAGDTIERGDILVEGRRIRAVAASGEIAVPSGTQIINLDGKTIVPGFIGLQDTTIEFSPLTPFSGLNRAGLEAGVATAWSPGSGNQRTLSNEEARQVGLLPAKRNRMPGCNVMSPVTLSMRDQRQVHNAVARCEMLSDGAIQEIYAPTTRLQRQWAAIAGLELGTPISVEPQITAVFHTRVGNLLDGLALIEHGRETYRAYNDLVTLWVKSGSAWNQDGIVRTADNARDALRAGVIVGVSEEHAGTDIVIDGRSTTTLTLGPVGGMLNLVNSGVGITPYEGLSMLTMGGARALGLDADLGSIEVGKIADLVVLSCNPLQDVLCVTKPSFVVQDGWLFEAPALKRVN